MKDIKLKTLTSIKPCVWKIEDDIEAQLKPALNQLLQEIQNGLLDNSSLSFPTLETFSYLVEEGERRIIKLDRNGVKIIDPVIGKQEGRKVSIEEYVDRIDSLDQIKRIIMNLEFYSAHSK